MPHIELYARAAFKDSNPPIAKVRKILAERLLESIAEELNDLMTVEKEDDFFAGGSTYRAYLLIERKK